MIGVNESKGTSPSKIFQACRDRSLSQVKEVVEESPSCIHDTDRNGRIPLHEACRSGHLEVASFLIEKFPGGRGKFDFDKNLPIHDACHGGNTDLVRLLVNQTVNAPEKRNCFGRLPIHEAARAGNAEIVRFLRGVSPLSLRSFDDDDCLPLHHACHSGNVEVVECLLQGFKKGGFQLKDVHGMLPMHHACFTGSLELVHLIFEHNTDAILVEDVQGRLPIDIASGQPQNDSIICFLSRKHDEVVAGTSSEGITAIAIGSAHSKKHDGDSHSEDSREGRQKGSRYWLGHVQFNRRLCVSRGRCPLLPLHHHHEKTHYSRRKKLIVSVASILVISLIWFALRPSPFE